MTLSLARLFTAVGVTGWPVLKLNQMHSGIVHVVDSALAANAPLDGDAAVTALEGILLGVQSADCLPVLIRERDAQCVAAIHAGWRGTAAGIARNTVERLVEEFKSEPANLFVAGGPHIGVCCYEIGAEVVEAIAELQGLAPGVVERHDGWSKPHLSLAEANRLQLVRAGIPETQIEMSDLCTRCRGDLFYSYRRDGAKTGRMFSMIGITA